MERLIRWLDECDDLVRAMLVHARPLAVTLLLLAVFLGVAVIVVATGARDLLASP